MHHTTRSYIVPIAIGSLLCLAAFGSVVWSVDPYTSGWIGHAFFFLTLFLSLLGIFTLAEIFFRKRFSPGMFTEQLRASFRQSFLLALLVVCLLLLQIFSLLFWWVGLTLILFIITVEIFLNA